MTHGTRIATICRTVPLFLGLCASLIAQAAPVSVQGVRMWPAPDHTRLVFDISNPVNHSLFILPNPDRVVIDLKGTSLSYSIPAPAAKDPMISRIRSAPRSRNDLRVVLDLKTNAKARSFSLKPNDRYGHRLVVDLYPRAATAAREKKGLRKLAQKRARDVIIAIDAGHGGEDPGASGPRGVQEKAVVLAVAKQLADVIRKEPGMRPVLIRSGDYYVSLRRRMEIARKQNADLFLSLHADAFRDSRVRGSSVYVLSRNGASSEAARWLARSENKADLVGGVSLDDKDDDLAAVLLDLSQNATLRHSYDAAGSVLHQLRPLGKTHKRTVQKARFVVLKSPDIPSMLIEMGFISNPNEERNLKSVSHQRKLARAIFRGLRTHFWKSPPPGTILAAIRHTIERGETLSGIAKRYGVPVMRLRSINDLTSDQLRIGQVLRIPPTRYDS